MDDNEEEMDIKEVYRMLVKQDDVIDIQRTIIQLLLVSGFLTLLLLIFIVYRLNFHFKLLKLLRLNKTPEKEFQKDTKVRPKVLEKTVRIVDLYQNYKRVKLDA